MLVKNDVNIWYLPSISVQDLKYMDLMAVIHAQWLTAEGGKMSPDTSHWEIFADLRGKEREGRKGKWIGQKENRKREVGKLKMEGGKLQNEERTFSLLKLLKFVLGLPKWEFSTGKKHFRPGKNIRENAFAPSEKHFSYAPIHARSVCICD